MMPKLGDRIPLDVRFYAKVNKGGPLSDAMSEPCWLWTGAISSDGYGAICEGGRHGRTLGAHRVAWELANGSVPEGTEIDHLCRTRGCVNPAHLEPASHGTNVRRGALTKLPFGQVEEIRLRKENGEPSASLAREYGISREYVWRLSVSDARATA